MQLFKMIHSANQDKIILSSSDNSDMILLLLSLCGFFPVAENSLSDGTEVTGADKKRQASFEKIGNS